MTYLLEKSFTFEAMHYLKHHDGKCRRPHGHSYRVILQLKGEQLDTSGPKKNMLIDFEHVSQCCHVVKEAYLDHCCLNETLQTDSPTSEFIAQWLYEKLKPKLPLLAAVTVSETNTTKVTYQPNEASFNNHNIHSNNQE